MQLKEYNLNMLTSGWHFTCHASSPR